MQVFNVQTELWNALPAKQVFCHAGYTQLLNNSQIDNTLELELGKVESDLPTTLAALDAAAQNPTTKLPVDVYENLCWYCAFLWRISPFAKAKAPAEFVIQINMDLEHGRCDLLRQVLGVSENDMKQIQSAFTRGKKVIIDSQDFLQLIYRIQCVLRCKEDFVRFRHFTKWVVYNSPVELPISDIALVQVGFKDVTVYLLPVSPHQLLAGTIRHGEQSKSDGTSITSNTLPADEAQYWADVISYAAQWSLVSQNIIPDVLAMRQRGATHVNFVKIVDPVLVVSAGVTDFNGTFGVRLVEVSEYTNFIHSYIRK